MLVWHCRTVPLQELRTLGKGGYGLVVAAVNRLDGRQYAVKKIRMPAGVPAAGGRLMREVATLARLQAPNIVRYFQARAPGPKPPPVTPA